MPLDIIEHFLINHSNTQAQSVRSTLNWLKIPKPRTQHGIFFVDGGSIIKWITW